MTEDQRLEFAIEKAVEKAIATHVDPMAADLRSVRRAIVGVPEEGNLGILLRMNKTEKRVAAMLWAIPIWVSIGTAGGTLFSKWIGL